MSQPKTPAEILLLPDIPVYQDIYCSQELTDRLCRYMCENRPEFVQELIEQEKLPFPDNRDGLHGKYCNHIEFYLRDEAKEGRVPELSMLGMIDLIYEIDRRVRNSLGLFDIPVVGASLAPTPDGPFPKLIDKPIWRNAQGKPSLGMTQELVDELAVLAYENNHEISYVFCERKRRLLRGGYEEGLLSDSMRKIMPAEHEAKYVRFLGELLGRLSLMCNIPNYEQIKALEPKGLSL